MKELEYPFDAGWILRNKRRIRKELIASGDKFIQKKIAILGGSTTANIREILNLFLLNFGINAAFYESGYGLYYEDAVFDNNELFDFNPDIIYIHTTNHNIIKYPTLLDSKEKIDELINIQFAKYETIWNKLTEKYDCTIIQNNFEMPQYRLLGNKDVSDVHGAVNFISRLNTRFNDYAENHNNFFICDINYISADYGLREWGDSFYWYMYKYALNVNAIPYLAFNVANIIKSVFGKNKKGLVLDLDNTLWGGVIGDDGQANIKIGNETPDGQVYTDFQKYLKSLKSLGVTLNIDSKNDKRNALLGLSHPDSVLSEEDFIEIIANWETKSDNLIKIAKSLNVLPESLVFVDDNPAERYIVSEQIPEVSVPDIGESHQYIVNMDRSGFFEMTYTSEDDLQRNKMYQENAERLKSQLNFKDYGEYLDSLQMKAIIREFEEPYFGRITQLTNKSNQFNLTTRRYTQSELKGLAKDKKYITLYGRLTDRFGDNGIVTVCIGRIEGMTCHIELWLMSCRVIKRDMEYAMMDALVKKCQALCLKQIHGYYYSTDKNKMVKDFYGKMGFNLIANDEKGSSWELSINNKYVNKNKHIQVVSSE